MDSDEFSCYIRIDKSDLKAKVTLDMDKLDIMIRSNEPATKTYALHEFSAQRRHPTLPMIQLRFKSSPDSLDDCTLVFKLESGEAQVEQLNYFFEKFMGNCGNAKLLSQRMVHAQESKKSLPDLPEVDLPESEIISANEGKVQPAWSIAESQIQEVDKKLIEQEHQRLLSEDLGLASSYNFLVGNNYITPGQFWEEHAVDVAANLIQPDVAANEFLATPISIPRRSDATQSQSMIVTNNQIKQIFNEHPGIEQRYHELVPAKMLQGEFWTRFFQSSYYAQMIGAEILPSADTTFPEFDSTKLYNLDFKPPNVENVPHVFNLTNDECFTKPGYGSINTKETSSSSGSSLSQKTTKKAILERFNRYGISSLQQLMNGDKGLSSVSHLHHESYYEDLEQDTSLENEQVKTSDTVPREEKDSTLNKTATDVKFEQKLKQSSIELIQRVRSTHWNTSLIALPKSDFRFLFLLNTSLIQQQLQSENEKKLKEIVNQTELKPIIEDVKIFQNQVRELLRLYWTSKKRDQSQTHRLIEGLKSQSEDIKNYMDNTFTYNNASLVNPRALCTPILDAIKFALDHHDRCDNNLYGLRIKQAQQAHQA